MRLLLIAALLIALAIPATSHASPFSGQKRLAVDTVGIVNPWLPVKVDKRLTREAVGIIRASGLRYAVGKFRTVDDPFETFDSGRLYPEHYGYSKKDPFYAEFAYWFARLVLKKQRISLVTSPPWQFGGVGEWKDNATPYYAGIAQYKTGLKGCLAYASAAEYGKGGASVYRKSLLIRIHELLHCGGAQHIDTEVNVMNSSVSAFLLGNTSIPLLPQTIKDVKEYLQ